MNSIHAMWLFFDLFLSLIGISFCIGVCTKPGDKDKQSLTCTPDLQKCTYSCQSGYESKQGNDAVKMCQLDGLWVGPDLTCVDKDECLNPKNCAGDNENCENTPGTYRCNCKTGYTRIGKYCSDVDECRRDSSNTCHTSLATCSNTPGSYSCQCKVGYAGDGRSCTDVDECADGGSNACDKYLAKCSNRPGSYSCRCKDGYTGDGRSCTDINECDQNKCHEYATCNNTAGSFICTCKEGYKPVGMDCIEPVIVDMPQVKVDGTSFTIQVTKLDSKYEIKLQVIVEKLPQRSKREASDFPETIHDYEKAINCSETSNCFYIAAELNNNDADFVVGDNEKYGKYRNPPLKSGTNYNIYTRGISYNNANPKVANVGEPSEPLKISTSGPVQTPTVEVQTLNGSGSVVAWHVVVLFLVSGFIIGILFACIVVYFKRRYRNRKPAQSNHEPQAELSGKVDSIYQDLDLTKMNEEECYQSLTAVNSGGDESDYTELNLARDVEDNYQTLLTTSA